MTCLLLISCSASKSDTSELISAIDLVIEEMFTRASIEPREKVIGLKILTFSSYPRNIG